MTIELWAVLGSAGILFIAISAQGIAGLIAYGPARQSGARDDQREPTIFLGRTTRSVRNHIESMALFVPVALVGQLADAQSALSAQGALLYLGARATYLPLYWFGIPFIRTIVFTAAVAGAVMAALPILTS